MTDQNQSEETTALSGVDLHSLVRWEWFPAGRKCAVGGWLGWLGDNHFATVWSNGLWHTWDAQGSGGENGVEMNPHTSMHQCVEAGKRQRFIPANSQAHPSPKEDQPEP